MRGGLSGILARLFMFPWSEHQSNPSNQNIGYVGRQGPDDMGGGEGEDESQI